MKLIPQSHVVEVAIHELRFIKIRQVLDICGKSKSSMYAAIKRGEFPSPVKLGERSSAWVKSEVLKWAQERLESRPSEVNPKM